MPIEFKNGYAFVIGVGGDLLDTVQNALGLSALLQDEKRCAYSHQQVITLTGGQANRQAILEKLAELAQVVHPDSILLIYFAGHCYKCSHSILGDSDWLMPNGYDINRLAQTAISGKELTALLVDFPTQKILVLLDCCHTGEAGEIKDPAFTLIKSALPTEILDFIDNCSGRALIAASQEGEISFSGSPYSAFTSALIEALSGLGSKRLDGYVYVADVAQHISQAVPRKTNEGQHPIVRLKTDDDFTISWYAGGQLDPDIKAGVVPLAMGENNQVTQINTQTYTDQRVEVNAPITDSVIVSGDRNIVQTGGEMSIGTLNIQAGAVVQLSTGLHALSELVQVSKEFRQAVIKFRSSFATVSEQVNLLGDYKDLHDLLHQLQFSCYNLIEREAPHFPEESVLEILEEYENNLENILASLQAVVGRTKVPAFEIEWVKEVALSQADLKGAVKNEDAKLLKGTLWRLKRLLTIQPPRINTCLNNTVHALHLEALVQALEYVQAHTENSALDPNKLSEFKDGLHVLKTKEVELGRLTNDHDHWQAVESELNRIEALIVQDLGELEMSWPDLQIKAAQLYQEGGLFSQEDWAVSLRDYAAALTLVLTETNPVAVRRAFRKYRHEAGNRFFKVDVDLKSLCGELREVSQPLAELLRSLE